MLIVERESAALKTYLESIRSSAAGKLVSSYLLYTELHCSLKRREEDIQSAEMEALLSTIALSDVERSDLTTAPSLPGRLRSSDAIHLATAIRLSVDVVVAYDSELQAAATTAGLEVANPL